jgi:hypothetical protein
MKRHPIFLTALVLISGAFLTPHAVAQSPEKMSYQAVVRNSGNQLVTNQAVGIKISILQGTVTGTAVYEETQATTTNTNGLVTVEIGEGTAISGTFSAIDWANGPYFVKIETDPAGGTNYNITGTSQLLSVPYALYSKKAENEFSGNYNDLTNKPSFSVLTDATLTGDGTNSSLLKIAQQTATSGQILKWNGSTWEPGNDLTGSASTPDGSSGHVQFNNAGSFGGDANFFWDNTNKRLGIGLNTPAVPLEIEANSDPNYPHLLLNESEDEYARLMFKNTVNKTKNWTIAGTVNSNNENSLLNFWYFDGTSGDNILAINGNGRVGINTTQPGSPLQVHSNTTYSNGITPIIKISDNYKLWNIGLGDDGDRFSIASEDYTERFTIMKSNGNVGVGTTSPSYKLQVGMAGDGTQARANAWNLLSDARLKKDLTGLTNSLDMVEKINGYYYYWNTGIDKTRQVGFSAQELKEVIPEVVSEGDDGYLSVEYGKMTPLLIEAIKELKAANDILKLENKQQQSRIESLETRLSKLEGLFEVSAHK